MVGDIFEYWNDYINNNDDIINCSDTSITNKNIQYE